MFESFLTRCAYVSNTVLSPITYHFKGSVHLSREIQPFKSIFISIITSCACFHSSCTVSSRPLYKRRPCNQSTSFSSSSAITQSQVFPSLRATCFSFNRKYCLLCSLTRVRFKHLLGCYFDVFSFQMAGFAQRFNDVTSEITHISELVVYRKYPIERADRVTTRCGDTILVSIRDRDTSVQLQYKVFLPQRYAPAFGDAEVQTINDGATVWYLVSKGRCPKTNSYQLSVE